MSSLVYFLSVCVSPVSICFLRNIIYSASQGGTANKKGWLPVCQYAMNRIIRRLLFEYILVIPARVKVRDAVKFCNWMEIDDFKEQRFINQKAKSMPKRL